MAPHLRPAVDHHYFLRDVPDALWLRFKAKAKMDNMPMRLLILKLIEAYADGKVSIAARRVPQ